MNRVFFLPLPSCFLPSIFFSHLFHRKTVQKEHVLCLGFFSDKWKYNTTLVQDVAPPPTSEVVTHNITLSIKFQKFLNLIAGFLFPNAFLSKIALSPPFESTWISIFSSIFHYLSVTCLFQLSQGFYGEKNFYGRESCITLNVALEA